MKKGFFLLAGPPGSGKTTSAQETFQKNCTIKTGEDVLHYFKEVVMKDKELQPPLKEFLIDAYSLNGDTKFDEKGDPIYVPIGKTVESILKQILRVGQKNKDEGKPPPFEHVIIDEAGELWELRFEELCRMCQVGNGQTDTRKAYGLIGQWTTKICDDLKRLKTVNVGSVLIAHDAEPDPENKKQGGGKFPSGTVSRKISGKTDGTLLRVCKDFDPEEIGGDVTTKYYWECKPSEHWAVKLRGLRPSDMARIPDLSLTEVLSLAGWTL